MSVFRNIGARLVESVAATSSFLNRDEDVKPHLRILPADTSKNELLDMYISQVERLAESELNRTLTPRTYQLFVDDVACNSRGVYGVKLFKGPATALSAVDKIGTDGSATAIGAGSYYIDGDTVVFTAKPTLARQAGGLRITYVAGYTGAAPYVAPASIKMGLLKAMYDVYWNPGSYVNDAIVSGLPDSALAYFRSVKRWAV